MLLVRVTGRFVGVRFRPPLKKGIMIWTRSIPQFRGRGPFGKGSCGPIRIIDRVLRGLKGSHGLGFSKLFFGLVLCFSFLCVLRVRAPEVGLALGSPNPTFLASDNTDNLLTSNVGT